MWWMIIPSVIGIGIKFLLSEEEKKAYNRWKDKRDEVERIIKKHQRDITNHIQQTQKNYNFHVLVASHYSSVQAANTAYKLLKDARITYASMNNMLKNLKEQRTILQKRLDEAKRSKNFKVVHETIEELKIINELRKNTFDERDKIKKQMDNLLAEVRRLNHQTRMLKELIRDKCGVRGREWYKRLENRTKIKKQLSGK